MPNFKHHFGWTRLLLKAPSAYHQKQTRMHWVRFSIYKYNMFFSSSTHTYAKKKKTCNGRMNQNDKYSSAITYDSHHSIILHTTILLLWGSCFGENLKKHWHLAHWCTMLDAWGSSVSTKHVVTSKSQCQKPEWHVNSTCVFFWNLSY